MRRGRRGVGGVLNDFPLDYYDRYPEHLEQVMASQIRDLLTKYVNDQQMAVIVVAPAEAVKSQLEKLGQVEVVPMPAKRDGAKGEGLKKAA